MSCMSCVVSSTVTPRSRLSRFTNSRTASFDGASRPMVGRRERECVLCSSAAAISAHALAE